MLEKYMFRKPKNPLEQSEKTAQESRPSVPEEMFLKCPVCESMLLAADLADQLQVCPRCGYHFRLNARQRIALVADEGSFEEWDGGMTSRNIIDFPDYDRKLAKARQESGENESVVCGLARIGGQEAVLCVMEPFFIMGSMGTVTGEKITRAFELATAQGLPVVVFTVSGGARMQESILSLMQMAKTSGAVKRHSDAGLFYLTVFTDPTTGGVTASFAMEGDIILAEPGALVGFAGPRVIRQTIRQKLPPGFQRAEFLLEKGFIDAVVPRSRMKETIVKLLQLHCGKEAAL